MNDATIRSFSDLDAWQDGHRLVLAVYATTKKFPREELFGLMSQLRRAAVSVTSNIAEGFSRRTAAEKRHLYSIAEGSLIELQNQFLIARDVGYIDSAMFTRLANQSVVVHRLIRGLMRSAADRSSVHRTA